LEWFLLDNIIYKINNKFMENSLPTLTPQKTFKNKTSSLADKVAIISSLIVVIIFLVLVFLFYNQSQNWQQQFHQVTERQNQLSSSIEQIKSQLSQTQNIQEDNNDSGQTTLEQLTDDGLPKPMEEKKPSEPVSREAAIISAVEQANPAVVSIIVSKDMPKLELYYESPFGDDPFFKDFDLKIPRYRQKGTEKKQIGAGTGFIVSESGLVVSNKHVVAEEDAEYAVLLSNGEQYIGEILSRDPLNDIAFLRIKGEKFPFINLGDSDKIKLGQTVIAIGNALGEFQNSVSTGIVSGLKRSITAGNRYGQVVEQLENVIQTDAAINPGNSGGPLLNLQGEVIGVNVAVASAENIGFALPVNDVKKRLAEVKEHGRIMRPVLGVRYALINKALQDELNLSVDYGALLVKGENVDELAIIPGGPADKAGLKDGDVILEINAIKVTLENNLSKIISQYSVGDKIGLRVLRQGKELIIEVILEEMDG
jgi:serine protease Do